MVDCNFKCIYNSRGECQQGGGECLSEDCPSWKDCNSCARGDDCEV